MCTRREFNKTIGNNTVLGFQIKYKESHKLSMIQHLHDLLHLGLSITRDPLIKPFCNTRGWNYSALFAQ